VTTQRLGHFEVETQKVAALIHRDIVTPVDLLSC
jgi:hypothetical protein